MRILSAGTVRARGHQPSPVDCPTCLALPGQRCGGLQQDVYHKPRLTAWKREEVRQRKAAQRPVQEVVTKRETSRPQPSIPIIDELASRGAYSELVTLQETITNELVAQYGWSDADIRVLKDFGPICFRRLTGEPPCPVRSMDKEAFVNASTKCLAQRRSEVGLRESS
jgi:hypothetical protein